MSKSLYWEIIPTEPKRESIYDLKFVLAKKLWGSDGTMGEGPLTVGKELVPYLEGIVEGNGSGDMGRDAKKLMAAIQKYGKVNLSIKE